MTMKIRNRLIALSCFLLFVAIGATYFWKNNDYLYSSCDHSIFQNHSNNPNSIELDEDKMIAARDIYPNEEILVCYESFDDDFDIYKNTLI